MRGGDRPGLLRELRRVVPEERVVASREARTLYAYDATLAESMPDVVVYVRSAAEVANVLKLAGERAVPVVPRGAGTGLSGGSVPARGGIALVLAGMNLILEIDRGNMVAVCEPGVVTGDLQEAVERCGLFYPPDPASLKACTLGGNVAENAGGPHGLKYGVTGDYVLGLDVVLASGELVRLGGRQLKNVTGYNLVQFFVGSEGTLGVITGITLRLLPLPAARRTMACSFAELDQAAAAVTAVLSSGVIPATLELMDKSCINCVEDYLHLGLDRQVEAMLLIEVDGMPEAVRAEIATIDRVCRQNGAAHLQVAVDAAAAATLWRARRAVSPAIARVRPTRIGEDICVPRSALGAMVREIRRIAGHFALEIVIFGHAGDGNLHPNILCDRRDRAGMARVEEAAAAIFAACVRLGGTLSGEHGIGLSKKPFLSLDLAPPAIRLMQDLKRTMDPAGILNPGKIFSDRD
ncbi:MAG TPA: FAD-linked oxidase C-terminal domain-containing protein [Spirochaetia bacterium]|nr:FAD-linked oxidase C-terminal domain-containing protein [Spirochaetia bacterium]